MKEVWYKKHRPKQISDYVFQDKMLEQIVSEWIEKKFFGNILLIGEPGTGKTSLAKLLIDKCEFDDSDVKYISASLTNGIEDIREKVVNFAERSSFGMNGRVVVLDECLEENEKVRIGTLDNWKAVCLKDLEWGVEYPVVSFNMDTGEFENDTGTLISEKEDTIYRVDLENDSSIQLNAKHPFIIIDNNGGFVEMTIEGGLSIGDKVVHANIGSSIVRDIVRLETGKVRNLTVHKNHTFITENGIVTHNCDHLSPQAQAGLRNLIGEANAQFVLIGNYPHKITPALKSRCMPIVFSKLDEESFIMRMIGVLIAENVQFNDEQVMEHFNAHYPDLRKTINSMEFSTVKNVLHSPINQAAGNEVADWMQVAMVHFADGNLDTGRQVIIENITYDDYDFFYTYLYKNTDVFARENPDKRDACIIAIADAMSQDVVVANREINLSACLAKLGRIYRK